MKYTQGTRFVVPFPIAAGLAMLDFPGNITTEDADRLCDAIRALAIGSQANP